MLWLDFQGFKSFLLSFSKLRASESTVILISDTFFFFQAVTFSNVKFSQKIVLNFLLLIIVFLLLQCWRLNPVHSRQVVFHWATTSGLIIFNFIRVSFKYSHYAIPLKHKYLSLSSDIWSLSIFLELCPFFPMSLCLPEDILIQSNLNWKYNIVLFNIYLEIVVQNISSFFILWLKLRNNFILQLHMLRTC